MIALAFHVLFSNPCAPTPLLETNVQRTTAKSVGGLTLDVLESFEAKYQGSEQGLSSAFGSATGMDALEVISDSEMKSYGWCYEVDGKLAEVLPGDYPLTPEITSVHWYMGYAHYKNGNWISQCTPAYQSKFLCKK
jgi:hypothetical protein